LKAEIDGQQHMVAWAWQRPDGGRSLGYSGCHYHENWARPEYQRFLSQAALWTLDHVLYGLTLLNRWAGGEANPWATADWEASWRRGTVTSDEWQVLRDSLRQAAASWKNAVTARSEWDDLSAAGALASAAHTAYHLGAIRQIVAALKLEAAGK
jgi:hypothetical protein